LFGRKAISFERDVRHAYDGGTVGCREGEERNS